MKTFLSRQLQHGLSLTSDHKQRGQAGQDPFLYQKENLLRLQLPGLSSLPGPGPGVVIPPHFQGGPGFPGPGFHFRGFPGNFGPGRLPPMRWIESVSLVLEVSDDRILIRFHPGFAEKPHFPAPPGYPPLLGGEANISLR